MLGSSATSVRRAAPRSLRVGAVVLLGALGGLTACGETTSTSTPTATVGPLASCKGNISVATDLPTGGSEATVGRPMENGARLAVEQASSHQLLGGCTITFKPMDDTSPTTGRHDPATGANNMKQMVADTSMVGVIGTYNSGVALTEMPIANNANLAMISPGNTNPGLTVAGADPTINTPSLRPTGKITYFRVISHDIYQSLAVARVAYDELKLRRIYDFDDSDTAGLAVSKYFGQWFTKLGGTVVQTVHVPANTKDYSQYAADVVAKGADGVLDGGVASAGGGLLRKALADRGVNIPFLGLDGIVDPQTITDAGSAADGMLASSAADTTKLPSAQRFVTDYKVRFEQDPTPFSAYAYDAMNVLLNAIAAALTDAGGQIPSSLSAFRSSIVDKIQQTQYDGAIGHISFDQYGDIKSHVFSIYVARKGSWVYKETVTPVEPS